MGIKETLFAKMIKKRGKRGVYLHTSFAPSKEGIRKCKEFRHSNKRCKALKRLQMKEIEEEVSEFFTILYFFNYLNSL